MSIFTKFLLIFCFGGAGAISRYGLGLGLQKFFPTSLAVFLTNVLGCFLFGLVWTASTHRGWISPEWGVVILVGFLGSFTTFSTFIFDSHRLLESGGVGVVLLNLAGQILLGWGAFILACKMLPAS